MQVRIVSDGTPAGTKVLNEKGEVIHNVEYVCWEIDMLGKGPANIILHVTKVPTVLCGNAQVMQVKGEEVS